MLIRCFSSSFTSWQNPKTWIFPHISTISSFHNKFCLLCLRFANHCILYFHNIFWISVWQNSKFLSDQILPLAHFFSTLRTNRSPAVRCQYDIIQLYVIIQDKSRRAPRPRYLTAVSSNKSWCSCATYRRDPDVDLRLAGAEADMEPDERSLSFTTVVTLALRRSAQLRGHRACGKTHTV